MMISSSTLLAAFACALTLTTATTLSPRQTKHNAIYTPSLNELVPVGIPYKITWKPDVPGLVNIYLLRGPTENIKLLSTIVEGIQNTGSYTWTPDANLEDDKTHYGLNLTMPGVPGEFQYSTQFGISNPIKAGSGVGTGNVTTSVASTTTTTTTPGIAAGSPTGAVSTSFVATTEVTVTSSNGTVVPTSVTMTGGPYSNGTVPAKTSASVAHTSAAKANGTTAVGAQASSVADGKLAAGLGAVFLAFGAALMI